MDEPWSNHGQTMEEVPINSIFIDNELSKYFGKNTVQTLSK
ncbi:MAG: hypothetical protein N4A37_06920 [Prolixibacteraceae bacterium]|nr:hypothetical protein [Prolixibacteraceae bacterium]